MQDNGTPEWVRFFREMERSQRSREDRIERDVRPCLESGKLPTPADVRGAINSLVGEKRQELLRYHQFWREHTLRKGLDSLVSAAHQASVEVSRHDATLARIRHRSTVAEVVRRPLLPSVMDAVVI